MHDQVLSRIGQALPTLRSRPSMAGTGLLERMRTTTFALLGALAAMGLGLVAIFSQAGLPILSETPIPALIEGHDSVSPAAALTRPRPVRPDGSVAAGRAARVTRHPASPVGGLVAAPGSRLSSSQQVAAPTASKPHAGGGKEAPGGTPTPAPSGPSTPAQSPAAETAPASAPVASAPAATTSPAATAPAATTAATTQPGESESGSNSSGSGSYEGGGYGHGSGGYHGGGYHHWAQPPPPPPPPPTNAPAAPPAPSPPAAPPVEAEAPSYGHWHEGPGYGGQGDYGHGWGHGD
jgi:hypothetical protein